MMIGEKLITSWQGRVQGGSPKGFWNPQRFKEIVAQNVHIYILYTIFFVFFMVFFQYFKTLKNKMAKKKQ